MCEKAGDSSGACPVFMIVEFCEVWEFLSELRVTGVGVESGNEVSHGLGIVWLALYSFPKRLFVSGCCLSYCIRDGIEVGSMRGRNPYGSSFGGGEGLYMLGESGLDAG